MGWMGWKLYITLGSFKRVSLHYIFYFYSFSPDRLHDSKLLSSGTGSIFLPSMLAPKSDFAMGTWRPCTRTVTVPGRPARPVLPTRLTYSPTSLESKRGRKTTEEDVNDIDLEILKFLYLDPK